jgi:hypothetical protein
MQQNVSYLLLLELFRCRLQKKFQIPFIYIVPVRTVSYPQHQLTTLNNNINLTTGTTGQNTVLITKTLTSSIIQSKYYPTALSGKKVFIMYQHYRKHYPTLLSNNIIQYRYPEIPFINSIYTTSLKNRP